MSLPSAYVSPALNRSSTLERFERSNASEIRNGIMFDFYPGHRLPHIHVQMTKEITQQKQVLYFKGSEVLL